MFTPARFDLQNERSQLDPRGRYAISTTVQRPEDAQTRNLLTSIVHSYQAGLIGAQIARASSPNPIDFDRAIRGISCHTLRP